jgi:hypothetical protein
MTGYQVGLLQTILKNQARLARNQMCLAEMVLTPENDRISGQVRRQRFDNIQKNVDKILKTEES